MPHGSILYNTWSTDDGKDRAWFLLRKTLEQARLKYDLSLDGAVDIDRGNAQYMITFRNDHLKMGFSVSFFDITRFGPSHLIDTLARPTLNDFVDALDKQARDTDMGLSQWGRDPVDVAWYLLRRVIEMADRRSDFKLTGRLSVESHRIQLLFEAYGLRSDFYLDKEVLTEGMINPADIAQEYGDKICRDFQKNLNEKSDYIMEGIGKEKQAYGLRKKAREIEAAKRAADESKRSFVITDVMSVSKYIHFSCNEALVEPIKKYGVVRPDPSKYDDISWYIRVNALYDFTSVLNVLRAIEAADDCVHAYLRATCRKTDLVAWWPLDEKSGPNVPVVQDIYFDSHADAVLVMGKMKAQIKEFGWVSVGDLYSLAGLRATFQDEWYGWDTLFGSHILYVPDQGYRIQSRDPKQLS